MQESSANPFLLLLVSTFVAIGCSGSNANVDDGGNHDGGSDAAVDGDVVDAAPTGTSITGSLSVTGSVIPVGGSSEALVLNQVFDTGLGGNGGCGNVYHNIGAIPAESPIHSGPNGEYASLAFVVCTDSGTAYVSIVYSFVNGETTMRSLSEGSELRVSLGDENVKNPYSGNTHQASYEATLDSVFATITNADAARYSAHLSIPLITLNREFNPAVYPCEAVTLPEECPDNGPTLTISGELQIDRLPAPPE